MYDISTKTVSRLKGELSTAFVNVAESNANAQDEDCNEDITLIDSGIYEKMPAMNSEQEKITIVRAQSQLSLQNKPIYRRSYLHDTPISTIETKDDTPKISISSGYSVIKR